MSLLSVNNLEKIYGADTIFTGLSFRLEWRQKLGLIGRNGAGKTTLLRILTNQEESDKGTISFWPGIEYGYLKQEEAVNPANTVLQEAEAAFAHVLQMEQRLRDLEHDMAEAKDDALTQILEEYGLMHDRFDAMGGYDNLRDIPGVLNRLGFSMNDMKKQCGALSGGEKTRLALARLLLSGPDILFLDEPTNHLDIEAIEWLESFLKDFGGAVLLVSHDRYFLDQVVTSTAEIENRRLTLYNGNFSAYLRQKEANKKRQADLYEREQQEAARLIEFFEKWKNTPSRRSQAVQRKRMADKLLANATPKPTGPAKSARFGITPTQHSGSEVVIFDRITMRYGDRSLFSNLTGLIRRGDRVGVVGPNGAGKSTLIKILLGRETPTEGMARLGASVNIGYFAQDTGDLDLDASVLENMLDAADIQPTQARTHLGRFLFTGDDVFRPVRLLSGGEKNKLALAQLTYLQPNLLVLDEPTNHLDMDSREALGKMLQEYKGTLLLISHDRYLLSQVANRIIEVSQGSAALHDFTYEEYREWKRREDKKADMYLIPVPSVSQGKKVSQTETLLAQKPARFSSVKDSKTIPTLASSPSGWNAHQLSKEKQRAKNLLSDAERKVEEVERRMLAIEEKLANPSPYENVVALSQEHGGIQQALEQALVSWEKAAAYLESLGN